MTERRAFRTLLFPPLAWLVLFFVLPLGIVLLYSVGEKGLYGGVTFALTFEHYREAVSNPLFITAFIRSLLYSIVVTVLTLLFAYPMAYAIACASVRWQKILMFLIILPFWTNFLVRMYSFVIVLADSGLINAFLLRLGVISEPLPLLNSLFSVLLGFVYWNLPFMVLPIFASLDKLDAALVEASMDLGAGRARTFFKVILPWSLPGVVAGIVFVFVPTLGCFVIPDLLGGPDNLMIGNVITMQFLQARNWPLGSALAMLFVFFVTVLIALYIRYYDPARQRRMTEV